MRPAEIQNARHSDDDDDLGALQIVSRPSALNNVK